MKEPETDDIRQRWISGHVYRHESLDPVLRDLVHPLVSTLARERQIDAFFFIRYGLGGPHVRLRLRALPEATATVQRAFQEAAERFLALTPSTRPLGEDAIRRGNLYTLANDPHEQDEAVYPDNCFRLVPFRPETERYGGPALFRASLDLFTLSSVAVLSTLSGRGDTPRSALLLQAFRFLFVQALGFAADEMELRDLLRYGVDSMGTDMPGIIEKADRVARSRREVLLSSLERGLSEAPGAEETMRLLSTGFARLSAALATADRNSRAWIGGSHLHMAASRLGLSNAEEVYLSRLLVVTLAELRDTALRNHIRDRPTTDERPAEGLDDLLAPALAALARSFTT